MRGETKALAAQLVVLSAVVGGVLLLSRFLPLVEWISSVQKAVATHEPLGGLLYPLLVAVCNLLLLPGGVLSLGGGFFFGLWWGTLLVLTGNILGAAAAYAAGRFLGRQVLLRRLHGDPRWAAFDEAVGRHGPRLVFYSQLNPLFPTSLFNYFYGVMGVPFWVCLGWIALGQLPGLFLYAYLGTLGQLGLRLARGETSPGWADYAVWFGGLAVTLVVSLLLARTAVRVLRDFRALREEGAADSGS